METEFPMSIVGSMQRRWIWFSCSLFLAFSRWLVCDEISEFSLGGVGCRILACGCRQALRGQGSDEHILSVKPRKHLCPCVDLHPLKTSALALGWC